MAGSSTITPEPLPPIQAANTATVTNSVQHSHETVASKDLAWLANSSRPAVSPHSNLSHHTSINTAWLKAEDLKVNKFLRQEEMLAAAVIASDVRLAAHEALTLSEAFARFIDRGNVVDLAVGIVMGASFTAVVNSFVNDLTMPVVGLLTQKNLANLFLVMKCASTSTTCITGSAHLYGTVDAANADNAATWNYGAFLQNALNFLLISLLLFLLVRLYAGAFLRGREREETKECAACAEKSALRAMLCRWCRTPFPVRSAPSGEGRAQAEGVVGGLVEVVETVAERGAGWTSRVKVCLPRSEAIEVGAGDETKQ